MLCIKSSFTLGWNHAPSSEGKQSSSVGLAEDLLVEEIAVSYWIESQRLQCALSRCTPRA